MSEAKDGGAAFPTGDGPYGGGPNHQQGMSLRDYFAAAALTGMGNWTGDHSIGLESAANNKAAWAYRIADAILRARSEQGGRG